MTNIGEPINPKGSRPQQEKAALRGEPSYVWRAGQARRFRMISECAGDKIKGRVLENGCGVGIYIVPLAQVAQQVIGLEIDFPRALEASQRTRQQPNVAILSGAGENLPFPEGSFDFVLSHEVLEHVADDAAATQEMVRILKPGGRLAIFVPNQGYPFETHGVYWQGRYHFGNIPLVNYLPRSLRDKLAPHVRTYSAREVEKLFKDQPVTVLEKRIIFGAYDNIIARFPTLGRWLRAVLQALENTPLQIFGLSHFWVVEKSSARPD